MNANQYLSTRNKVFFAMERVKKKAMNLTPDDVREIGRQLKELRNDANQLFSEPPLDDLKMLSNMYADLVDGAVERNSAAYDQASARLKELESKTFVDTLTADENATVEDLSFQLQQEFRRLPDGGGEHYNRFIDKALSTRLGALAILRFPKDLVVDANSGIRAADKTPSAFFTKTNAQRDLGYVEERNSSGETSAKILPRDIERALEKSKTPLTQFDEKFNAAAIEKANADVVKSASDGRQMRRIRDILSSEAESSFFSRT